MTNISKFPDFLLINTIVRIIHEAYDSVTSVKKHIAQFKVPLHELPSMNGNIHETVCTALYMI